METVAEWIERERFLLAHKQVRQVSNCQSSLFKLFVPATFSPSLFSRFLGSFAAFSFPSAFLRVSAIESGAHPARPRYFCHLSFCHPIRGFNSCHFVKFVSFSFLLCVSLRLCG
jgi:hypothetical protein